MWMTSTWQVIRRIWARCGIVYVRICNLTLLFLLMVTSIWDARNRTSVTMRSRFKRSRHYFDHLLIIHSRTHHWFRLPRRRSQRSLSVQHPRSWFSPKQRRKPNQLHPIMIRRILSRTCQRIRRREQRRKKPHQYSRRCSRRHPKRFNHGNTEWKEL